MDLEERIKDIEDEIRRTPLHKASEHHIGTLRARMAKLREEQVKKSAKKKGSGYSIKKQGDATVMLAGYPSVGKSTLINALTRASSKVGDYDFTTLKAVPGMLEYKNARIQLVDLPGIIDEASKGKGRGREVLSAARNADLIIIVLEAGREDALEVIRKELYQVGIRLDKKAPDVIIKKKVSGGLNVEVPKGSSKEKVKAVLQGLGLVNAEVVIRKKLSDEELIDAVLANRHYCPSLIVANKTDVKKGKGFLSISAKTGKGLEELKEKMWRKLGFLRVYLKKPGKPVSPEPLILRGRVTPKNVLNKIRVTAKYAKVWGKSVKHGGQRVSTRHALKDEDIISFY
jgi:small GTP-binding protein